MLGSHKEWSLARPGAGKLCWRKPLEALGIMIGRLCAHWVYGGFLAGLMLFALTPLFAAGWSADFTLVFIQLPLYMLHQYEEHDADRFRIYVNRTVGDGAEALTPAAVFVINIVGVWAVVVATLYLARYVDIGLGLIAVYLSIVNALAHIAGALVTRRYNPGLVTAAVLFLPVGGYTLWAFHKTGAASTADHLIAIGASVIIHALIITYVNVRRRTLLAKPGLSAA